MDDIFPIAGRLLRALPPEAAHWLTVAALRRGWVPSSGHRLADDPLLTVRLWGLTFANPVGLAAGFDKNAEVADAMLAQGFGFVETGTITLRPQFGNPRPRVFRLPRDQAMINRLGFNNSGLAAAVRRLAARCAAGREGIVGVNIGPNRDARDPIGDLAAMAVALAPYVSYLAINLSSPNTPGLRGWQRREPLARLIEGVQASRARWQRPVPLLVKVAPDIDDDGIEAVADVALSSGIDGLIATNTTIERPAGLHGAFRSEAGGLSGPPLFARSTEVLAALYRATGGRLPLIGVGGIASGSDAFAKIKSGASLVQVYTALIYQGPRMIADIRRDLGRCLRAEGFPSLAAAVGSAAATGSATAETAP